MAEIEEVQAVACEVVEIAPYDPNDARMGDFVRVRFEGEEQTRRYSLGKLTDRGPFKVGAKVRLRFVSFLRATGAKDGSGRVFHVEKRKVIGVA